MPRRCRRFAPYTRSLEMTDHPHEAESVHSATASAHISHAVIAAYAAAAAVEVPGVRGIWAGHSTPPERRIDPERAPKGVRVGGDGARGGRGGGGGGARGLALRGGGGAPPPPPRPPGGGGGGGPPPRGVDDRAG